MSAEKDEIDPKYCILYLFFLEKKEYFLLLGRAPTKECADMLEPSQKGS